MRRNQYVDPEIMFAERHTVAIIEIVLLVHDVPVNSAAYARSQAMQVIPGSLPAGSLACAVATCAPSRRVMLREPHAGRHAARD